MTLSQDPLVLLGEALGLLGAITLIVGVVAVLAGWAVVRWYDHAVRGKCGGG